MSTITSPVCLVLGVVLAACGSQTSAHPGGGLDSGPAAVDAATPDTAPVPMPIVSTPTAAPFGKDAMVPLSTGPTMDYDSAFFVDPTSGAWVVAIDRFLSQTSIQAELEVARSLDGLHFDTPTKLDLGSDIAVFGPRAVVIDDLPYLLFQHGNGSTTLSLARRPFTGPTFGSSEDLVLDDPNGYCAWANVIALPSGRYALSYDHYGTEQEFAFGDGLHFNAPQRLGGGVQGRVAAASDGTMVYTYQNGVDPQTVYVRISSDGTTWSNPTPASSATNVHDATPFARLSGGVDVYYIADDPAIGFRIRRRSVDASGHLGVEQTLSATSAGSLTQPRPHRLGDGSIVLTFAQQVTSNVDTDSYLVHLTKDDAP